MVLPILNRNRRRWWIHYGRVSTRPTVVLDLENEGRLLVDNLVMARSN